MTDPRLHGLYLVTDTSLCATRGVDAAVRDALRGGARVIQYRDKSTDTARRRAEATSLRALCTQYDALLIINDDIELAGECSADGVHLGRDDMHLREARSRLGDDAVIGISCYADIRIARNAAESGAHYVAFGSVFASDIKPDAVRAPLSLVTAAAAELDIPVCAIGGIDSDNIHRVVEAGADMAAVISAVLASRDIEQAARQLSSAFPSPASRA